MALGSPIFPWSCEGKLGFLLEALQGQRDLIEACVQDLIFLSREDRDLGFPFQTAPGSQASPRGEAEDSTFLSSRDTDLLEPNEWTQGWRASSSSCVRAQSHLTLCDATDCTSPGSSVRGILLEIILKWEDFLQGIFLDPGIEPESSVSSSLAGRFFTTEPPGNPLNVSI